MTGIIDYGVGNLFSLRASLQAVGAEAFVSGDADTLSCADNLILPGVGAFGDAAAQLRATGLEDFVHSAAAAGVPLLGICLGMQLLFEQSEEYGIHAGLGLLSGQVISMAGRLPPEYKIPHMGWNRLHKSRESRLLADVAEGDFVYFVHSYFAVGCEDSLAATTEYGTALTAAVERGSLFGCQFHPEKSGRVGLAILRRFAALKGV